MDDTNPSAFAIETVVSGLNVPVAGAFTPDGRLLVTEKIGTVRVIKNGVLLSTPLIVLNDVNVYADHGLLGIAIDPDFEKNGYIYLSYTYENNPDDFGGPKTGRIIRLTTHGDTVDPDSKIILVGSVGGDAGHPSCNDFPAGTDCIPSDAGSHSVGGLRFGPDGKLYASLADGSRFDIVDPHALDTFDTQILAGKILRINTDGTGPADNPFYNGDPHANQSKVYAYGFRNPFRLNFNPLNNQMYIGDVGWYDTEEINLGVPGGNYGWPCREGREAQPNYDCVTENYVDPLYTIPNEHTATSTFALIGGTFSGAAYPMPYQNNYFFGVFGRDTVKRVVFDKDNNVISHVENFLVGTDGPVDFFTGPDGSVYFISIIAGEVRRITYNTNRPPNVVLDATPQTGSTPLEVSFSSSGTTDPQGYSTVYNWDFGDGSEISHETHPQHIFVADGTYTVILSVSNDRGASDEAKTTIIVGDVPVSMGTGSSPQLISTTISPHEVYAADLVTISATVTNRAESDPILIDIEIHDDVNGGEHLAQQYYDNVVIDSHKQQTFDLGWIAPQPGRYRVSIGLYDANWAHLKEWIDNALTFTVHSRSPE
ncbi:MAG: hypothetical protein A2479_03275 [Candidatus Magasanikbacteria bacterium RIFOXYC2_FULL_39_8]|nr:MAG: hypothetical protein A2479_03275 [Candidatus Magasanikbacteria bacterium RIFOXYC2_FULL_39_8]